MSRWTPDRHPPARYHLLGFSQLPTASGPIHHLGSCVGIGLQHNIATQLPVGANVGKAQHKDGRPREAI